MRIVEDGRGGAQDKEEAVGKEAGKQARFSLALMP